MVRVKNYKTRLACWNCWNIGLLIRIEDEITKVLGELRHWRIDWSVNSETRPQIYKPIARVLIPVIFKIVNSAPHLQPSKNMRVINCFSLLTDLAGSSPSVYAGRRWPYSDPRTCLRRNKAHYCRACSWKGSKFCWCREAVDICADIGRTCFKTGLPTIHYQLSLWTL